MKSLKLIYSQELLKDKEIDILKNRVKNIHDKLHLKNNLQKNLLGWVDYPIRYDVGELKKIKEVSKKIRNDSEIFIVLGVGGSYLGSRAVIEALSHSFYNLLSIERRRAPQVLFIGNNFSGKYMKDFLDIIESKEISLNVISKSGNTLEVSVAFRILKKLMADKYGDEYKERVYITTGKNDGYLRKIANIEGYELFNVPDNIGGRFSFLTPAGLLPIAVSGVSIDKIMKGAKDAVYDYESDSIYENDCYKYALIRNKLYNSGKNIEVLVSYEPSLKYFAEWWKQLFGESEGKDGKGLFPASMTFSTDLHSLGQYIQDGKKQLFETIINIESNNKYVEVPNLDEDIDKLNFLSDKSIGFINDKAFKGAVLAHEKGDVPNLILNVPKLNEYYIGKMMYFFMKACAMSGYLLRVDPFNQPGVEEYKRSIMKLLKDEDD